MRWLIVQRSKFFVIFFFVHMWVVGWGIAQKTQPQYCLTASSHLTIVHLPIHATPSVVTFFAIHFLSHTNTNYNERLHKGKRQRAKKKKQFLLPHMRYRKMDFKRLLVRSLAIFISDGFCFLFPFHTLYTASACPCICFL